MSGYRIEYNHDNDTLTVGFTGETATNTELVVEAVELLEALDLQGGKLLKITGAASVPIAYAIAHKVIRLFNTIAIFDPKLGGYVVAVTRGVEHSLGDLIN